MTSQQSPFFQLDGETWDPSPQFGKKNTQEAPGQLQLVSCQNQSESSENYWSWNNIALKQFQGTNKQKANPFMYKNKPYVKKQVINRKLQYNLSESSLHSYYASSDDDKNPQARTKRQQKQVKWSTIKSHEETNQKSNTVKEPSMLKHNLSMKSIWDQTLQKLFSPVKVKIRENWKDCQGWIKQGKIVFASQHFSIRNISKVKILPQSVNKHPHFYSIKFVYFEDAVIIGLPINRFFQSYTMHFSWFIAVIISKLKQKGFIRKGQFAPSKNSTWSQVPLQYSGIIFKRSQFLGNWVERRIQIKNDGIYSYHSSDGQQKQTFFICKESIKYVWTRFQIFDFSYLVIKIKHGIRKTEFAIPINDLFTKNLELLHCIYRLMMNK